ncbi:transcriptional regulator, DeoR family [Clostridium sp. DSM 8431]|uniref:DeoR/GlpR family DNA-binding transcription regulator n=1 Tax=Clostridium sp. DSM 8431 TaxID=1761781 RepID=UPI0008E74627|nr:DeoR/GlpR family DNA-binding transcription regulator [Clostridium sp. DSM 8431]SFU68948.1 transcriptional regulator, DeoR family [Clostridium sp. DSM 8431]
MVLTDRWTEILNYLRNKKFATVEEMMETFNISRSTLRRDLIAMEDKGLIIRTRGGAEIIESEEDVVFNLEEVLEANKAEKIKIANKAAKRIKDNDVIFIDSGSTCYYIVDFIKAKNITVVTNGIAHIQKLISKGINTYILGGYAKPELNLIIGEDTEKKVSMMNFDIAFLGTMGIDKQAGFTTSLLIDGEVKRAVIKSSKECFILADKSKFNVRRIYTYGSFEDAEIITSSKVDFDCDNLRITY